MGQRWLQLHLLAGQGVDADGDVVDGAAEVGAVDVADGVASWARDSAAMDVPRQGHWGYSFPGRRGLSRRTALSSRV